MSITQAPVSDPRTTALPDRIVVIGGGHATLDFLRLATIRSDDVVLLGMSVDEAASNYARRYAVERFARSAATSDLHGAASVLVALGDMEKENALVRAARRQGTPIHVSGRPLVCDFTLLEFLERRSSAQAG